MEKESKSVGLEKKDAMHESSEIESGSWRDCCQSGINMATQFMGLNLDQNWIDWID